MTKPTITDNQKNGRYQINGPNLPLVQQFFITWQSKPNLNEPKKKILKKKYFEIQLLDQIYTTMNWIDLEWFSCRKSSNWWWQVKSHNHYPWKNFTQACGGIKYICLVWMWPTKKLISNPRTSITINKHWSDKCKTTGQKSTKEVLVDELERYFRPIKTINWHE